jgi:hypothetical protein
MRNIREGRWQHFPSESEYMQCRRRARVQIGRYAGPGRYFVLRYEERCPRNCCDESVIEILTHDEVAVEVREEIIKLARILRAAKEVE